MLCSTYSLGKITCFLIARPSNGRSARVRRSAANETSLDFLELPSHSGIEALKPLRKVAVESLHFQGSYFATTAAVRTSHLEKGTNQHERSRIILEKASRQKRGGDITKPSSRLWFRQPH